MILKPIWGEEEWHDRVLVAALVTSEPLGRPPNSEALEAALAEDKPLGAPLLRSLWSWLRVAIAPHRESRDPLSVKELKAVVGGALSRLSSTTSGTALVGFVEQEEAWREARRAVLDCRSTLRTALQRRGLHFEKKPGGVLAAADALVRSVDAARPPKRWRARYQPGGPPLRAFGGTMTVSQRTGRGVRSTGLRAWVDSQLEVKLDQPRVRKLAPAIVAAVEGNATSRPRRVKSR